MSTKCTDAVLKVLVESVSASRCKTYAFPLTSLKTGLKFGREEVRSIGVLMFGDGKQGSRRLNTVAFERQRPNFVQTHGKVVNASASGLAAKQSTPKVTKELHLETNAKQERVLPLSICAAIEIAAG